MQAFRRACSQAGVSAAARCSSAAALSSSASSVPAAPQLRYVAPTPTASADGAASVSALGRRKTSAARAVLEAGDGAISVNRRPLLEYFPEPADRAAVAEPFAVTATYASFDVAANVSGGGVSGQSGAVRLAISRALLKWNPDFRGPLKKAGLLTRDPRMVERKKPGLKKARRAKQWVKR